VKLNPRTWKAVVFDFDGTLAQLNLDFPMMRAAVRKLPLCRAIPEEKLANLMTIEMIEAAGLFIAEQNEQDALRFLNEAYRLLTDIEIEAAHNGKLFPGTRMLLAELKRRAIKTGIVTRNCRAAVEILFPDSTLYADATVTRNEARNVKPHPGHIWEVLELLGVPQTDAVMVGDHPMDITSAKQAGSCAVGVLTGSADAKSLYDAGADMVLKDASELLGLI